MSKIVNNIELNISNKVRYTINGDKDKYIELNTGDAGIIARFGDAIPVINTLATKYEGLISKEYETADVDTQLQEFTKNFKALDLELREVVNNLFDYDVCSVCASDGSMFDPYGGEYRFYAITQTLLNLYEDTLSTEMNKLIKNMKKHTDKYTPKDHLPKKKD